MAKHSQHKSLGTNSKKFQRIVRAKARREEFNALSPEQKEARKLENKLRYDSEKSR